MGRRDVSEWKKNNKKRRQEINRECQWLRKVEMVNENENFISSNGL